MLIGVVITKNRSHIDKQTEDRDKAVHTHCVSSATVCCRDRFRRFLANGIDLKTRDMVSKCSLSPLFTNKVLTYHLR